jgi:hypothetical protein
VGAGSARGVARSEDRAAAEREGGRHTLYSYSLVEQENHRRVTPWYSCWTTGGRERRTVEQGGAGQN